MAFDITKLTYNDILQDALAQVPNNLDKRQGSVIYDALAPACYVIAKHYMHIYEWYINTYAVTASGDYLDLRVGERGLYRYSATYAIKLGHFSKEDGSPVEVPLGSRFCSVSDTTPIYYKVTAAYKVDDIVQPGYYELTCENVGTQGNAYTGDLVNLDYVQGVEVAEISQADPLKPARDTETDRELRLRYFDNLKAQAFGGNIQNYKEILLGIDGVGAVQVYPVWNGGGTVKVSIISPDYLPVSQAFVNKVKEMVDPTDYEGEGIGLAPIGHKVTVSTATPLNINVSFTLEHTATTTVESLQPLIEQKIDDYLLVLRENWAVYQTDYSYVQKIYIAQVLNAILDVPGVVNVSNLELNGDTRDITLVESSSTQQLPVLGTVTIDE